MKIKSLEWKSANNSFTFGGDIISRASALEGDYLIVEKEKDYTLYNKIGEHSYQELKERIKDSGRAKQLAQKHFEKAILKQYAKIKQYLIKE